MNRGPVRRRFGACILFAGAIVLLARAGSAGGDFVWTQRASIGPSPRAEFGLAFDSARAVTVLFGGADNLSFNSVFPDTWEWDGTTWTLRASTGPSARCDNAMAFDSPRAVTVSFGGYNGGYLGDTWEWDGKAWVLRTTVGPSPRADSFMVYDSQRQVMVLFGGQRMNGTIAGDTWEYEGTGAVWTLRSNTGPPARWIARMAYDSARGVTVLFGGLSASSTSLGDTWEWDGTTWTLRAGAGPSPRFGNAMAYDSERAVSLIFGGGTTFFGGDGQTWEWDGAPPAGTWTQHILSGPSPRTFVKVAYDSARCRMVLFGGYGGGQFRNDTWEFGPACPADCAGAGDGLVDVVDFLALLGQWDGDGTCDTDGDQVVGTIDFLALLAAWGACQ